VHRGSESKNIVLRQRHTSDAEVFPDTDRVTECSARNNAFLRVESRQLVAAFDGGAVSSDARALLLGSTDRAIGLVKRFAGCFHDRRPPDLIEHDVRTLVAQRVFGIALGYEDLNDHDQLGHDPVMATVVGKLTSHRRDYAPLAGKSTLNRLELSRSEPTRYHKISHDPAAIEALFPTMFMEAHTESCCWNDDFWPQLNSLW